MLTGTLLFLANKWIYIIFAKRKIIFLFKTINKIGGNTIEIMAKTDVKKDTRSYRDRPNLAMHTLNRGT
jgi:hypothetical protein